MKSYQYLRLHFQTSGIFINCTDKQTEEWIINEIQKIVPSCTAGSKRPIKISQLQGRDIEIGNWLVQQICLKGWEPFAVSSIFRGDKEPTSELAWGDADVLHFRLELT